MRRIPYDRPTEAQRAYPPHPAAQRAATREAIARRLASYSRAAVPGRSLASAYPADVSATRRMIERNAASKRADANDQHTRDHTRGVPTDPYTTSKRERERREGMRQRHYDQTTPHAAMVSVVTNAGAGTVSAYEVHAPAPIETLYYVTDDAREALAVARSITRHHTRAFTNRSTRRAWRSHATNSARARIGYAA